MPTSLTMGTVRRHGGLRAAHLAACASAVTVLMLLWAPAASAACRGVQAGDLKAAREIAARLAAGGHTGAADTAAVIDRSARRCPSTHFARAVASANERTGAATFGQHASARGLDLVGAPVAGGGIAWRLDVVRMSVRALRNAEARERVARLALARGEQLVWSNDPTRLVPDVPLQARVALLLARGRAQGAQDLGVRTVAGLGHPALVRAARALPLVPALSASATAVHAADLVGTRRGVAAANSLADRAARRLRAADAGTWTRINGSWATLAQHRALVRSGSALAKRRPNAATLRALRNMRTALRAKPSVSFRAVPLRAFFPWPLDGALDSRAAVLAVDKPAAFEVRIFAPDGTVVRTLTGDALPRHPWSATWNGVATGGELAGPGVYRYAVRAVDRAGNRRSLPGVGAFVVARDTKPPVVRSATLRSLGGAPRRELLVRWHAEETESPAISALLILRGRGEQRKLALTGTATSGEQRVAVRLPAGRYAAFLSLTDGSGNVAVARVGPVRFG